MTYGLFFFFKFIYQFYTLNGFFFLFFFFRRDDPCNVAFFFIVQQFAALAAPFDLLFEKGVLLCRQKKSIILLSTHNVIRIDILLPFHTFQIPRFEFFAGVVNPVTPYRRDILVLPSFILTFVISRATWYQE